MGKTKLGIYIGIYVQYDVKITAFILLFEYPTDPDTKHFLKASLLTSRCNERAS